MRHFDWRKSTADYPWPYEPGFESETDEERTKRETSCVGARDRGGERFSAERPLVYHLAGTLEHEQTLVITEDDYFTWLQEWMKQLDNGTASPAYVKTPLIKNSLLFLGYHFDDWEFRMMFQAIKSFQPKRRTSGQRTARRRPAAAEHACGSTRRPPRATSRATSAWTTSTSTGRRATASSPSCRDEAAMSDAGRRSRAQDRARTSARGRSGTRSRSSAVSWRRRRCTASCCPAGVMLLHAPSGAGKTSLIQARWCRGARTTRAPDLRHPGAAVLRAARQPAAAGRSRRPNRYVFSLVNALVGHRLDRRDAARMTIEEALTLFAEDADDEDGRQLVVIDQLEEALTLDPNDRVGQEEFFRQLGNALRSDRRWALLAIRDDYLGRLDRFRRFFPNELRATFRLDFLDADAAVRAVQELAAKEGVTSPMRPPAPGGGSPARCARSPWRRPRRRRRTRAADPLGEEARLYPYVEPVLLQVVCNNLWRILRKRPDFREISGERPRRGPPVPPSAGRLLPGSGAEGGGGRRRRRAGRARLDRTQAGDPDMTRRPTSSLPPVEPTPGRSSRSWSTATSCARTPVRAANCGSSRTTCSSSRFFRTTTTGG